MATVMNAPAETRVDLHLHSTASDGVLAPDALIDAVAAAGVTLCALTDHDTTAGLAAAGAAAARHGIMLIPGIEVSASHAGRTLHVVGLGIHPAASSIRALVDTLAEARGERAREIARRLDRRGLPGSDILVGLAGANVVTRTHFARELVRRGLVADPGQAFRRWLGKGAPAYAPASWPGLATAVAAIDAAGGIAVLAHPLRYTLSAGQRRELARDFRAAGGTALEVCVGGQTPTQTEVAVGLCLRAGLEGSVGSDCHDPALPWQRPGRLAKLPAAVAAVWERWPATPAGRSSVDTNRGAASA